MSAHEDMLAEFDRAESERRADGVYDPALVSAYGQASPYDEPLGTYWGIE